MNMFDCSPFLILIAIAFFMAGRAYERRSARRYSEAAERIKQKYQAHRGSTERV